MSSKISSVLHLVHFCVSGSCKANTFTINSSFSSVKFRTFWLANSMDFYRKTSLKKKQVIFLKEAGQPASPPRNPLFCGGKKRDSKPLNKQVLPLWNLFPPEVFQHALKMLLTWTSSRFQIPPWAFPRVFLFANPTSGVVLFFFLVGFLCACHLRDVALVNWGECGHIRMTQSLKVWLCFGKGKNFCMFSSGGWHPGW